MHQAGRAREAETIFCQVLDIDPDHADANHLLGVLLYQRGDYAQAVESIFRAIAMASDRPMYHSNLGNTLQKLGRLEEAIASFRKALAIKPDYADAHNNLGNTLQILGRLEEAVTSYREALAVKPDSADAHYNLGTVLKAMGRLEEAATSYRKALAIKPDYAEAHNNLGSVLGALERPEDAVASCHKALAIKPDHAEAHINLGNSLRALGRIEEAVASYHRALAIKPDQPMYHCNLGSALQELGRLEEAAASYQKALAIKPNYAAAHKNLGVALQIMGRPEESLASFRRAIEFDPAEMSALHMVASLSGETTEIAPRAYVRKLFDDYAARFDDQLVGKLNYKVPELMRRMVDRATDNRGRFRRALDLGCGTGLVGQNFKDIVEQVHGVDLSPKMIECARKKGIYSALHLADVLEFLEGSDGKASGYDLILAADVFIYIGDLAPVFAAIGRALTEGGLFVFSVESLEQGSYKLLPTGRYAHGDACISELASDCGLAVELCERIDLRKERDGRVAGNLYILRGAVSRPIGIDDRKTGSLAPAALARLPALPIST